MKKYTLLVLSLLVVACGDDESVVPGTAPDSGSPDAALDTSPLSDSDGDDVVLDSAADDVALDSAADDVRGDTATEDVRACDLEHAAAEAIGALDSVSEGVVTAEQDGDSLLITVDASAGGTAGGSDNPYVYVDISTGESLQISDVDSLESSAWWLAFKRTVVRTNSGNSGPGPLMVARVEAAFDVAEAPGPDGVWNRDDFIDDDCEMIVEGRANPMTAFGTWYDYDPSTHTVSPQPDVTYFVYEPSTHAVYKIAIESWDDGVFTLRVGGL